MTARTLTISATARVLTSSAIGKRDRTRGRALWKLLAHEPAQKLFIHLRRPGWIQKIGVRQP
ncbi:MAG: hypothetical protein B7Z73_03930 [Planctomycetia bacterium 21-64-5]|nr:MAG: hypothetical protein B7Z73_03930 [Planctomycetia bacterium 21-64-5]